MTVPRRRIRFTFWLDTQKNDESGLIGQISQLKHKRQFSRTIRDGIRLILDLRQGRTEVLRELFPWVLEANQPTKSEVAAPVEEMKAHLSRLEQLILEKQVSTPQLRPIPKIADPMPDLEIKHAANSLENPAFNMLLSTLAIGGRLQDLPAEVIEYGIQRGRLPESARRQVGPRPMKVPDVAPPSFDDLDVDVLG